MKPDSFTLIELVIVTPLQKMLRIFVRGKSPSKNSFTLIELVIVIAILAILASVAVLTINPGEQIRAARDSTRMSDLQTIHSAIGLYQSDGGTSTGSANTVYVSMPDSSATCANLGLPSLPTGWSYACSTSANYLKTNGTGWIPVPFSSISFGNIISSLPADPINTTSTGNYYTYVTGGSWELTSSMESAKYKLGGGSDKASKDGGQYTGLYELGSNLTLLPLDYGDTSLVGYWKFDEGSGTTAYDASGRGNNGTLTLGPSWVAGKVGSYSLSFDGSDDYIQVSTTTLIFSTTQNWSFSLWINIAGGITLPDVYYAYAGKVGYGQYFTNSPSMIGFRDTTNTEQMWYTTVSTNVWHNITYVANNGVMTIYLDNTSLGPKTFDTRVSFERFGKAYGGAGNLLKGFIDDARVYNRALSAAEVQALYKATNK